MSYYLKILSSKFNKFEFKLNRTYNKGDQVIIGDHIYESLSTSKGKNPVGNLNWIRIL